MHPPRAEGCPQRCEPSPGSPSATRKLRRLIRQQLPLRPATQHSGADDGPVSSTSPSQVHASCTQKSSKPAPSTRVPLLDAKRSPRPGDRNRRNAVRRERALVAAAFASPTLEETIPAGRLRRLSAGRPARAGEHFAEAKAGSSSAPRRMRSSAGTTAGDQTQPRDVALDPLLDYA